MTRPGKSNAAPALLAPRRAVAVGLVAAVVALGAACGGSSTATVAPSQLPEQVDPDVHRVALPDDLNVTGLLVDDQGCVVGASAFVTGAGTEPSVGTGDDCAAATKAAAGHTAKVVGGGGPADRELDKVFLTDLVRLPGSAELVGVGYREEHSDLFPTSALRFDVTPGPSGTATVERGPAPTDADDAALHAMVRTASGRVVVVGSRLVDDTRRPAAWWSDDALVTMHEVALPADTGAWSEANGVAVGADGRVVAFGSTTPTRSVLDQRGVLWWSDDGASWTAATHDGSLDGPPAVYVHGVAAGASGWLAVGSSYGDDADERPRLWRSGDGRTWRSSDELASSLASGAFTGVAVDAEGQLVVIGGAREAPTPAPDATAMPSTGFVWEEGVDGWRTRQLGADRPHLVVAAGDGWTAIGARWLWTSPKSGTPAD